MKKKLVVTAAVCALSAVCIFGATACGNGDDGGSGSNVPDVGPSIQVADEAAWNAAFDKTFGSESYTMVWYGKFSSVANGETYTSIVNNTVYKIGNEIYETNTTSRSTGEQFTSTYFRLVEGDVTYFATYVEPDNMWFAGVESTSYTYLDYCSYSDYTFENGKYIGNFEYEWTDRKDSKTIKINAQGYYSYRSSKSTWTEMVENNSGGWTRVSYKNFFEFAFCDIGTTTYTMPDAARQAIEDYKAANN